MVGVSQGWGPDSLRACSFWGPLGLGTRKLVPGLAVSFSHPKGCGSLHLLGTC